MKYESLKFEKTGNVGLITLDRPKALNALSSALMDELTHVLKYCEGEDSIGAMIITGSEKAFAAGADIGELKAHGFADAYLNDLVTRNWEEPTRCRKPIIAAVAGYALGGGCELAMMCDFIIAADNARFGQPEIRIGVVPGAGGTQRLARFVGKSKAMEMCLTGRMMDAEEAERCGLVSRVVPVSELVDDAVKTGQAIADLSRPATFAAKELVNRAFETTLAEGVRIERRMFQAMFATEDKDEGMSAFLEKRAPKWKNR